MQLAFWQYAVIFPLMFLAGLVDAVAGGGGLISLPALLIAGIPVHNAIGTNKLGAGMGTALATYRYSRKGYVPWRMALLCAVAAVVGSSGGANLALLLPEQVFKVTMLVVLPLVGLYILLRKPLQKTYEPYSSGKTLAISLAAALVIGAYDGFYGPGTGTFLLLLLTGLAHMKLTTANGVTKVINLTTNVTTLVVYLVNGKVWLLLGLLCGLFNAAGSYVGTRFFIRDGTKAARPLIMLVLGIFFVKVLLEVLGIL